MFLSRMLLLLLSIGYAYSQCEITLPVNPLTSAGLATPMTVKGCLQQSTTSFAEGAIYDPSTNTISLYNPLIINHGSQPEIAPLPVTLPPNAVVGIWFGTNG